jgi:hypothetical protein
MQNSGVACRENAESRRFSVWKLWAGRVSELPAQCRLLLCGRCTGADAGYAFLILLLRQQQFL